MTPEQRQRAIDGQLPVLEAPVAGAVLDQAERVLAVGQKLPIQRDLLRLILPVDAAQVPVCSFYCNFCSCSCD